ncbi:MAG: S8 family serine peptidase [Caldimonas sp.]
MRRTVVMNVMALAATLLLPLAAQTPLAQGSPQAAVAGSSFARVIVKYRSDSELMKKQAMTATGKRLLQTQALGDRIGVVLTPGIGLTDRSHVVTARGLSSASLAARIAAQKDVEYAVVDERKHIVAAPNDPFYPSRATTASSGGPAVGQWYLKPPGLDGTTANTAPSAINAEQAWDVTTGSATIVVAVLDTGVRFDHPDLQGGNVLPGYDLISADSNGSFVTANDGNGRDADASDPGDFVTQAEVDAATSPSDPLFQCTVEGSSWHGTQTLGLIGATTNNGVGIASVGRNVRVMPVRVLGKCGGYDSDIQAGILWAAGIHVPGVPDNTNPARVINMSLGGTGACAQSYIDAIAQANAAGAVVVASAGNSAGHPVGTPANCPGVIGVTGLRHVGDKVGFSDLGSEITISAPGGNCVNIAAGEPCLYPIMTTANSGTTTPVVGTAGAIYTDSFGTASLGTSFSAPLVSGTVALMLSAKPTMTPAEVKAALQASARPFPTTGGSAGTQACVAPVAGVDQLECYCVAGLCGAGMLDAHAAVLASIGVQARVSVTTTTPTAGQPVSVASTSVIGAGQSVSTYLWTIVSAGSTGAVISGANNASTVTVAPTAAGNFTISLTTTDNVGFVSTASAVVTVAAATVVTPPPSSGSSGGGGALGPGWLLLLLTAVLALAAVSRFERRRRATGAVSAPARAGRRR